MTVLVDLAIFSALLATLIVSGIITTRTLSVISSYLRLGHFGGGFVIMAIATGIPELTVGITAALSGVPELSLGDVIGSNIINLSLVMGVAVLIAGSVNFKEKPIKKETIYLFLVALLPVILAYDQELSRVDGFILIVVYALYLLVILRARDDEVEEEVSHREFIINSALFGVGVAALVVSARYLVEYATLIASEMNISLLIIGVFLLSFGTSIPELVFETVSLLHGYKYLAVGDLMGSTVANSTFIIGIVAILSPISLTNFGLFQTVAFFFALILLTFILFIKSENGVTRFRALLLIGLYILFLLFTEFFQIL
ncbi:MAG: sodium:calcium antiporter [Methanomicrobiales archaeon]